MPNPALTLFFHGTKSASDEVRLNQAEVQGDDELVSTIEKHYKVPSDVANESFNGGKLLFQGVGSIHNPEKMSLQLDKDGYYGSEGGLKDWHSTGAQQSGVKFDPKLHTGNKIAHPSARDTMHQALGIGVDKNVAMAVQVILNMCGASKAPSVINMVGWSRGGVTCVELANALSQQAETKEIPLNIFAADPVPGGVHLSTSKFMERSIPSAVKRYVQIFALDLTNFGAKNVFHGLKPSASEKTEVIFLPMPGDHGMVVRAGKGTPGKLTRDLAIRFLKACGSEGTGGTLATMRLSERDALDHYEAISQDLMSKSGAYPDSQNNFGGQSTISSPGVRSAIGFSIPLVNRTNRIGQMQQMCRGGAFGRSDAGHRFINEHHTYLYNKANAGAPNPPIVQNAHFFASLYS